MRHPQLLIHAADSLLSEMLSPAAKRQRWVVRHPREWEEVWELLEVGGAGVLVLRVGRDLEAEMMLLERVTDLFPDTGIVVVGDAVHAPLAGLAWDLGASYVLFLPQPPELLEAVVEGLMQQPAGAR